MVDHPDDEMKLAQSRPFPQILFEGGVGDTDVDAGTHSMLLFSALTWWGKL